MARTSSPELNIRTSALEYWRPERFEEPLIEAVSNPGTFVNQAFYDTESEQLIITVNGGEATTEPTDIAIANLPSETSFVVIRDGLEYSQVVREDDRLVITTPPLSGTEESYIIEAGVPAGSVAESDDSEDARAEDVVTGPDVAEMVDLSPSNEPSQSPPTAQDSDGCGVVSKNSGGTAAVFFFLVCSYCLRRRSRA